MKRLILLIALLAGIAAPAGAKSIQRVVSPGGIEAWLIENPALPIIALSFSFEGGSSADPAGKEGLANLAASLMDEGAGPLDAETFRRDLSDLAIGLGFSAGADRFSGSLRTVTGNADRAFELLRLSLTQPRFDEADLNRIRDAIASGIRRQVGRAEWLTQRAFFDVALPSHPYGRPSRGRINTLSSLSADDLHGFVAGNIVTSRLTIGVAGDISAAELGRRLDEVFGALPAGEPPVALSEASLRAEGRTILVDHAGPQSLLYLAQPGIAFDDPDYYAAIVMNHILGGGGFSSRLTQEVREKRGLTYGISSGLIGRENSSMIVVSAEVSNANVPETLAVIRAEWDKMASEGATQAELDDAIAYLTGSFPLALTDTGGIAGAMHSFQLRSRGIDYLDRRNGLVRAVTLDDVNRVAVQLLDSSKLVTVITGTPPKSVAADIVISADALARRELGDAAN